VWSAVPRVGLRAGRALAGIAASLPVLPVAAGRPEAWLAAGCTCLRPPVAGLAALGTRLVGRVWLRRRGPGEPGAGRVLSVPGPARAAPVGHTWLLVTAGAGLLVTAGPVGSAPRRPGDRHAVGFVVRIGGGQASRGQANGSKVSRRNVAVSRSGGQRAGTTARQRGLRSLSSLGRRRLCRRHSWLIRSVPGDDHPGHGPPWTRPVESNVPDGPSDETVAAEAGRVRFTPRQ
jgi:hypothetical protein